MPNIYIILSVLTVIIIFNILCSSTYNIHVVFTTKTTRIILICGFEFLKTAFKHTTFSISVDFS